MLAVLGIIAVLTAGYWVSLKVYPLWPCWSCKGGKRHYSKMIPGARRRCWLCDGTGEKPRLGVRLFMRGTYAEIKAGRHRRNY